MRETWEPAPLGAPCVEAAVDTRLGPGTGAGPRREPGAGGRSLHRVGPWRLVRVLGAGSGGTVHLAEPEGAGGGPVAVKVIHPHLAADPLLLARFLREGEMGRRVLHENVVRTLEVGTECLGGEQVPYLVMEWVQGRTLRDLLLAWGVLPEPLLREVARQMAAGLAAIHAAGLVHHDLKPENVILTDDQRVRIMDLGVARLVAEARGPRPDGRFAGTLLYAAPERFGGEAVGPGADLYALGVLCYELATGTNPFQRADAGAVMRAHLDWTPPPAALLAPGVSPFLSEVIATLLAKRPEARFPSATALGTVLAEGEQGPWWRERASRAAVQGARLPSIRVPRETRLRGRDLELDALRVAWREARAGCGRVVIVGGEPGLGKSRLVDAFLREAASQAAHVLYGTFAPTGGAGAVSDALVDLWGEARLVECLRRHLPDLEDLAPAYADVLLQRPPPAGGAVLSLEALHAATTRLVSALAAEGPVAWVVEDLHLATGEGVGLVRSIARAAEGRPVLLLVTSSPRDEGPEAADLRSLPNALSLSLGRLSRRDVIGLLREAFRGDALADQVGGLVATLSGGIPALVLEVVRALREGGAVVQQEDGSWIAPRPIDRLSLPPAATDRIAARLAAVESTAREVLEAAAVSGVVFRPEQVARVLGRPTLGVLDDLADVERRHGLVRAGRDTCRFDPPLVRDVLYQAIPEAIRVARHAAFADLLETEGEGELPDLVEHALAGGRDETARRCLEPALAQLVATHRHERAAALAGTALGRPGVAGGERRVDLLLRRAESLRMLGRREEAQVTLGDAVAASDALGVARCRVMARIQMGAQGYALGAYPPARRVLAEALSIARESGDDLLEAAAAAEQGVVLRNLGHLEDAEQHLDRALRLARAAGDVRLEARALGNLGVVRLYRSRYDEAEDLSTRQLALAGSLGDDRLAAFARMNLTAVASETGRVDECHAHALETLALARAVADRRLEAAATRNLGDALLARGERAAARIQHGRSLALARESAEASSESRTRLSLARLALAEGDLEEACREARGARSRARGIGFPWGEARASAVLGEVLRLLGCREEALEVLTAAREAGHRLGDAPLAALALSSLAEVEADEGHTTAARVRAEEALRIRRGLRAPGPLVRSLLQVGRLRHRAGDLPGARAALVEGLGRAREAHLPEESLVAAHGAFADLVAPAQVRRLLSDHAPRLDVAERLEAWFALFQASGDPADLREAEELARVLLAHVAPELRAAVERDVPFLRAVRAAATAGSPPGRDA